MAHHHLTSFTWDTNIGEFLFPGLVINGTGSLIILCVVLIILCVLYEGLKVFETHTKARAARERMHTTPPPATEADNLLRRNNGTVTPVQKTKFLTLILHTLLFLFHNVFGYLLMLFVMVYNVYVFLAVVFGLGLGYFLFGHISMKTNMDNIRAKTTHALHATATPRDVSGIDNRGSTATYMSDLSNSRSSSSTTPEMSCDSKGTRKQMPLPAEPTNNNVLSCRL